MSALPSTVDEKQKDSGVRALKRWNLRGGLVYVGLLVAALIDKSVPVLMVALAVSAFGLVTSIIIAVSDRRANSQRAATPVQRETKNPTI